MLPGKPTLMTVDPENIKAILATQFNDFGKGKDFHDSWQYVTSLALEAYLSFSGMVYSPRMEKCGQNLVLCSGHSF
jgi:hypothetical protein